MAAKYSEIEALKNENAFRFNCPVFATEVEVSDCFRLLEQHMKGFRVAGRNGCQACMSASKCPTREMFDEAAEDPSRYFSATPKLGRISESVLEAIEPILVTEKTLENFSVDSEDRATIAALNESSKPGRGKAKRSKIIEPLDPASKTKRTTLPPVKPRPVVDEGVATAAQTGDLSAAITAAVAAETAAAATPKHGDLEADAKDYQRDKAERAALSEPHTISPPGAPHDNPRMADTPTYVGPPVNGGLAKSEVFTKPQPHSAMKVEAPARGLSMIEIARQMQAKRNAS